jgi:hypothetical protein
LSLVIERARADVSDDLWQSFDSIEVLPVARIFVGKFVVFAGKIVTLVLVVGVVLFVNNG